MAMAELGYALDIASFTILAFCLHQLMLRATQHAFYWPLAGVFLALAVFIAQPLLRDAPLAIRQLMLLLSLPALFLLPPCFWLYVQGLTCMQRWHWQPCYRKHFILAAIGGVIAVCSAMLPADIRYALLVEGQEQVLASVSPLLRYTVYVLLITTFVMVLGWSVQAGCYMVAMLRQLYRYRAQLRQVFASTEQQELHWIVLLFVLVSIMWGLAGGALLYDNLVAPLPTSPVLIPCMTLLLVWFLASWGLRQKPGFAALYQTDAAMPLYYVDDTKDSAHAQSSAPVCSSDGKYQRSALHDELAASIIAKLTHAMQHDTLYLDAALSLPKLAKHIAVSPSYVSQTLNERLGLNFFDFINQYRVEAAKVALASTDQTVLDIAMQVGFNAKSSFYTAFKKVTGLTPSQYRHATGAKHGI